MLVVYVVFKHPYYLPMWQFKYIKNIYWDVDKGYVSSGYIYMNIHADLQQNGLESLMNDNNRIYTDTNETIYNGDVSCGIGLLNSHALPQDN